MNKEVANAFPTKRFFVDMLTRDIELSDAILDLLDNCVDGILRSNRQIREEKPYEGYWAKISFDDKKFRIEDNCGGIPYKLAVKYAFMMGRPKAEDDIKIPTVGMYGIGMKRAIFKMGKSSIVISQNLEDSFEVKITKKWMEDDKDWELPITRILDSLQENGTIIEVKDIRDDISNLFTTDGSSNFKKDLISLIGQHYGFIIGKGFNVFVNNEKVIGKPIRLLMSKEDTPTKDRLAPYIYKAELEGVTVSLAVGFYTPMLSSDEVDEEQVTRRSKEDAGWTIICNDRVVVHNDKSRLTGWGEAGVPSYHSQFIGITGVVHFQSNDAWKLPITTTKRGVDTSSNLYLYVKDFMREGLKKFTSYTNNWKADPENEKRISSSALAVPLESILSITPDKTWTKVKHKNNEQKLSLDLASPVANNPNKQIRFNKPINEIREVSEYLFETPDIPINEVGLACFDKVHKEAVSK